MPLPPRGGLYKSVPPSAEHAIAVSGDHTLYAAEYGNKDGTPLVYVHGGPGGGIPKDAHRLFDPEAYRIVLFDQRGCGRSSCPDRLAENTTDWLVADIEAIRSALSIERWLVMGSSYGSMLTALYAARNPERVLGCVLHGVFLGSRVEIEWLYEGGAARFYPERWREFEAALGDVTLRERPPTRTCVVISWPALGGHAS